MGVGRLGLQPVHFREAQSSPYYCPGRGWTGGSLNNHTKKNPTWQGHPLIGPYLPGWYAWKMRRKCGWERNDSKWLVHPVSDLPPWWVSPRGKRKFGRLFIFCGAGYAVEAAVPLAWPDRGKTFQPWGTDFAHVVHKIMGAGLGLSGSLDIKRGRQSSKASSVSVCRWMGELG